MILLKGAHLFDGKDFREGPMDLLFSEDRIVAIGADLKSDEAHTLDMRGKIVAPGFIDLHAHLSDPGFEWREDIATGSIAAAMGGFTTVVAMPDTDPVLDNPALLQYVEHRGTSCEGARILPAGCVSKGRCGEVLAPMATMADSGAVFFTDDGFPIKNSKLMKLALEYAKPLDVRVVEIAEEQSLTRGAQVNEGLVSSISGLKGWPVSAEYIDVVRGIALARDAGAAIHFTQISTARSLEAVREAKEEGLPVSCDVAVQHLVLDENSVLISHFNSAYKVSPPLRSREDVSALWNALEDGTVDAITTAHSPCHNDEKDLPFQEALFGIASLECSVAVFLDAWLKRGKKITLERVLQLFTSGPSRLLPQKWRDSLGTLREGNVADLTVLDLDLSRRVDASKWRSKARNCPWNGEVLTGWPIMTFVSGRSMERTEKP